MAIAVHIAALPYKPVQVRMFDVMIAGGGAAGLSAALVLGRARRRTLVVDDGAPRNAPSPAAHSMFTRDGMPPATLLATARAQLAPYQTVELETGRIIRVRRTADGFVAGLADGTEVTGRRLLLATGVRDVLPPIEGLAPLWGRGVLHCPYCHGWEVRDEPLAVHATGQPAKEMVLLVRQWSRDLLLCTDGLGELTSDDRGTLTRLGVRIVDTPIRRLVGSDSLERIEFEDDRVEARRAMFVRPAQEVASDLWRQMGCELTDAGFIRIDADHQTSVPGVYAAGDATTPMQQLIVAAASGAQAAIALNRDLVMADSAA